MRDFDPTAAEFISSGYTKRSRPGGFFYDPVSIFTAAAPSLIGAITSDGAGDVQQAGANQASGLQQQQYQQTRADLSPYRDTGALANNRLAQLLGLGSSMQGAYTPKTAAQLRSELIGQYTRSGGPSGGANSPFTVPGTDDYAALMAQVAGQQSTQGASDNGNSYATPGYGGGSYVDETGLQAAINAALAGQGPASAGTPVDDFGMLLKKYTGEDLVNDPGYQFRQSEGQKGVERSAAGRGGLFSGQAGKELQRFSQGLASTEFGNAFNRDQTYKGQVYGMLSGTSGAGQNAANMTGTAGANAAGQSGNYITQGANAQAAGMVGGANAATSGFNNYQNYNLLNSVFNKTQNSGAKSTYGSSEPYPGYYESIGLG